MTRRSYQLVALLVCWFCYAGVEAGEQYKPAFSMALEEFNRLSPADQKQLVTAAFNFRLERASNIHYESYNEIGNYEYHDGVIGKCLWQGSRFYYSDWRLGKVYRMEANPVASDGSKETRPHVSRFDAETRKMKSLTTMTEASERFFLGVVDIGPEKYLEENRFAYWLDGKNEAALGWFLFRYLVDHKDSFSIESPYATSLIRLTVQWPPFAAIGTVKIVGKRELILDPVKGFLPIRGSAVWEGMPSDGKSGWHRDDFTVDESKLINDIWMPTKLTEVIGSHLLPANVVNVWHTEVEKIAIGTVASKDLELVFPKGTKVTDRVKGVSYVMGDNEDPTQIQKLLFSTSPPSSASFFRRYGVVIVILAAVALFLGIIVWRRFRVRHQEKNGSALP